MKADETSQTLASPHRCEDAPTEPDSHAAPTQGEQPRTAPLPAAWLSASKSKRELPKAVKVSAAGTLLLLLFVYGVPKACGSSKAPSVGSTMVDTEAADARHLTKRRQLTEDDFRTSKTGSYVAASSAQPRDPTIDLEERKRRRDANPEDIRRSGRSASSSVKQRPARAPAAVPATPHNSESMLVFFGPKAPQESNNSHQPISGDRLLVPAATSVRITLDRDVTIRAGRTTVLAHTSRDTNALPSGAKLIGTASAGRGGSIQIRFRTLVLPTGQSVQISAEAIDHETGSSSLLGTVSETNPHATRSAAAAVSEKAAKRVAMSALGTGLLGSAARDSLNESRHSGQRSYSRNSTTVTLPRTADLEALFLKEVTPPNKR